jgi:two-component system response regulator FixJ
MNEPVVHVIDDDEGVRVSLGFLLEMHDLPAKTYASADEFLDAVDSISAGCIVTDVRMPGMTGLDLVRHLKQKAVNLPVIVITGHGDVPLAVEAVREGVLDFLEKPFDEEALFNSIQSALDAQAKSGRQDKERQRFETMIASLSGREKDVLRGIIAGKLNKVIAHELGISPRTVEVYRANVMTKTNASSLSELVRIALLSGF